MFNPAHGPACAHEVDQGNNQNLQRIVMTFCHFTRDRLRELAALADAGYCLDAPEHMPAGCVAAGVLSYDTPMRFAPHTRRGWSC